MEICGQLPFGRATWWSGVEFFELEDDNLLEHRRWSDEMEDLVVEKVRSRCWDEELVALLVGAGKRAKREMIALDEERDRDEEDGGGDDRGEASFSDE